MVGDMSLSFVSSARRRHGGLASAALFHPLVEAATGALPVIDPVTGRPAETADARPGSWWLRGGRASTCPQDGRSCSRA